MVPRWKNISMKSAAPVSGDRTKNHFSNMSLPRILCESSNHQCEQEFRTAGIYLHTSRETGEKIFRPEESVLYNWLRWTDRWDMENYRGRWRKCIRTVPGAGCSGIFQGIISGGKGCDEMKVSSSKSWQNQAERYNNITWQVIYSEWDAWELFIQTSKPKGSVKV